MPAEGPPCLSPGGAAAAGGVGAVGALPAGAGSAPAWSEAVGIESGEIEPLPSAVRYEVVGELGRGGMGRVTLVRDLTLDRLAARKVLPADRPDLAVRLWREARLGARLDHPNIVPIYDAGVGEDGRPWFVMRYVRGRTLRDVVREQGRSGSARLLRAMLQAAEAVSFAHAQGVVHRDLTPDNVLVGPMGDVQVADWGLARDLTCAESPAPCDVEAAAVLDDGRVGGTRAGSVLGTVPWLAPEQARGEPADRRSDVYALGALLRFVLTGAPPLEGAPEACLSRIAAGSLEPVPAELPPALGAVIERAMSPDPTSRYADASELASELAAWLDGRPVEAYAYTNGELLLRLIRRWRLPLSVVGAGLMAAAIAGVVGWRNTAQERDRAVRAEADALSALATSDAHLAARLSVQARRALRVGAYPEAQALAAHALKLGSTETARGVLAATASGAPLHASSISPLSHDGVRQVAPLDDGGALLLTDTGTLRLSAELQTQWHQPVALRAVAARGAHVLVQRLDERLGWLAPASGAITWTPTVNHYTHTLLVTPSGEGFALNQGALHVVGQTEDLHVCGPEPIIAGTSRGDDVWVACRDGRVLQIGSAGDARPAWRVPLGGDGVSELRSIAVLPGGDLVVGALRDVVLRIDGDTGVVRWRRVFQVGAVDTLQADEALILAGVERGGPLLIDAVTGALLGRVPADDAGPLQLRRSPDADELVSWSGRRVVWRLGARGLPAQVPLSRGASRLAVSPDGEWVALSLADGFVERWPLSSAGSHEVTKSGPAVFKALAWGPRGLLAVQAWARGGLLWPIGSDPMPLGLTQSRRAGYHPRFGYWLLAYGEGLFAWDGETRPLTGPGDFTDAQRDGDGLLLQHADGRLLRLADGPLVELGAAPPGAVLAVASDGRLAVGMPHGLTLHPRPGAEAVASLPLLDVTALAFRADAELLAVGTRGGEVLLLRVDDDRFETIFRLGAHDERVSALGFTPDGASLLSASWDATLRRWGVDALLDAQRVEARWGVEVWRAAAWVDALP